MMNEESLFDSICVFAEGVRGEGRGSQWELRLMLLLLWLVCSSSCRSSITNQAKKRPPGRFSHDDLSAFTATAWSGAATASVTRAWKVRTTFLRCARLMTRTRTGHEITWAAATISRTWTPDRQQAGKIAAVWEGNASETCRKDSGLTWPVIWMQWGIVTNHIPPFHCTN